MIASDTRIDATPGCWGGRRRAQHESPRWNGALGMRDVLALGAAASLALAVRIWS
jgi:hypothetical protein